MPIPETSPAVETTTPEAEVRQPDTGAAAAAEPTPAPAAPDAGAVEPAPAPAETVPEWLTELREAKDPGEALRRITKRIPREELQRDPYFAGVLGDMADKRARKLLEQQKAEEAEAERQRKIDAAVEEEDLLTLGELTLEEQRQRREDRARREAERAEAEQAQASQADVDKQFLATADKALNRFYAELPADVQRELAATASKDYGEQWDEGFVGWMRDVVDARVRVARTQWEKDALPALEREVLAKLSGQEPSAEITAGSPVAAGPVGQDEWDRNRTDRQWRQANADRISAGVAKGLIRR